MFYKMLLTGLLSLGVFSTANAQTYWLNMVIEDQYVSLPVSSNEKCSEALIRYVQQQHNGSISCDVMPLPGSANTAK